LSRLRHGLPLYTELNIAVARCRPKFGIDLVYGQQLLQSELFAAAAGASVASMPTADILRVLAEREEVRTARDWTRSQQLRDELRLAGVSVSDSDKSWSTLDGRGGRFPGHGGGGLSPNARPQGASAALPSRDTGTGGAAASAHARAVGGGGGGGGGAAHLMVTVPPPHCGIAVCAAGASTASATAAASLADAPIAPTAPTAPTVAGVAAAGAAACPAAAGVATGAGTGAAAAAAPTPPRPLVLEVGFGKGDSLLAMAHAAPHKDFVGVEVRKEKTGPVLPAGAQV
jgi:hypothetical protein